MADLNKQIEQQAEAETVEPPMFVPEKDFYDVKKDAVANFSLSVRNPKSSKMTFGFEDQAESKNDDDQSEQMKLGGDSDGESEQMRIRSDSEETEAM